MSKLVLEAAEGKPAQEWELTDLATVGRVAGRTVQLPHPQVSKTHARLERRGRVYVVIDEQSANGTRVNGEVVRQPVPLKAGDTVSFGPVTLHFMESQDAHKASLHEVVFEPEKAQPLRQLERLKVNQSFLPEAQLTEQAVRRDYEQLRIAVELAHAVVLERDLDSMLDKVLAQALLLFPAERGVALLLDEASGQLVPRRARHREGQPRHAIALSRTLLAEVVEQQAAVLCDDAAADQRFNASQSVIAHNFRSVLVVPFLDGGRVMGAIHLDSSLATGIFTQRDLRLLVGFAGQVALTLATHRLAHQMEEQTRVRDRLERMLSPNLVQEVVAGKLEVKKGGEQRRATVLFSDIRGFTSRTERTEPRFLVALLNDYFELMVDIVFKYQGTLDKYVGDEVMAVWGAPVAQADDPQRAVGAALDMMYTLSVFNSEMGRKYPGFEPLSIGIGIHTGDVISGYMGSTKTMQYTVIGDSVNTGARFCSAAAPGEILVCEATARACEGAFRFEPLPPKPLKGKSAPVPVFRVLGRA